MGEKTFDPTPKRLAEMREKGQVVQSPELTGAITLLVAIYYLGSRMSTMMTALRDMLQYALTNISRQDFTLTKIMDGGISLAWTMGKIWFPFTLIIAATGVAVGLVQTRGMFSTRKLRPDFSQLNPVSGIKRIFSKQGMFETAKGVVKMALLAGVLFSTLQTMPLKLAMASQTDLRAGAALIGETLATMAR